MHIVIIHHDLFFQGGQYVAAKLAEGFFARGHQVDVIVSHAHADAAAVHGADKAFQLPQGVKLHVLPSRHASHNVFAMGRLLRRLKPDVIIPNSYHYNLCVYLAQKFFGLRIPVVYVEHCLTKSVPLSRKLHPEYWVARLSMHATAKIVAVADGVKRCVEESYGLPSDRVVRIYNPIFENPNLPEVVPDHLHPRLVGDHPFTVVGAGALCDRKNFSMLVEAFANFHKNIPNSQLLIFGGDSDEKLECALNEQITRLGLEDSAVLAGFTEHLQENLQKVQLFVLTSKREAFGIVLIEALAAGNAVISTDCPVGPREILRDGALGQLVPVGDVRALAEAMGRAYRRDYKPSASFLMMDYVLGTVLDRYETIVRDLK